MRQLFYYKMRQKFITKCDSFITKCNSYYKLRRFYCKMRRLLQIATVHILFFISNQGQGIVLAVAYDFE